jgi:HD-GYP domain-containing protein (c-di-GMP phosphodiesterase class II)
MSAGRVAALGQAALLMDLGLSGLPLEVANRSRPLTPAEEGDYQCHPIRSLRLVQDIALTPEQLSGIAHHHERIDGRGYPMGLAGHEIPEFARILAITDTFVGLTTPRTDGGTASPREAVNEIGPLAGRKFDPLLVAALSNAVDRNQPDM